MMREMATPKVDPAPPVELLHPFYLDTDMSMAFAAALAGGIAIEQEDVQRGSNSSQAVRNIEGNLRLFGRLGFGGKKESAESSETGTESRLLRQHTEASIFISLYNELRNTGRINTLDVEVLEPGSIVSAELGPAVAPLRRIVEQMIRLVELLASMLQVELPVLDRGDADDPPVSRQDRRARQRKAAKELAVSSGGEGDELRRMYALFVALQDDLDQSGMIDVVLHREDEPSVVLTLDKRFTEDQAVELLHTSRFTVVGKVTQVLKTDEEAILLYRRSVVGMLPALTKMSMWGMMAILAGLANALETDDIQKAAYAAAGVQVPETDEEVEGETESEEGAQVVEKGPQAEDDASSPEPGDEGPNLGDITPLFPSVSGPVVQILPLAICA
jgi:hypothetical protein